MDVFGKLNEFLNNEDESFKYDSIDMTDDSLVKDKSESPQQNENNSQNSSKSKASQDNSQNLRRSKRGRSSNSQNSSNDDILDLTNEFIYPIHGGKKRNRRKLADEIPAVVIEEQIDLSNIVTPDSSLNISNTSTSSGRGGRKGRKPKAPRKVSYKKALELLTAPIPEVEVSRQPSTEFIPQACSTQRTRSNDFAVDLTGDVVMSDIHNKNPLFQKVDKVKEKIEIPEERFSLGLEDDIDLIYVNVKVKGKIKKYRIKMDQMFYELFKMIADDEDIPTNNVVLFIGERRILPEDTPDSIDHRVSFIYNCRFTDDSSTLQVNKKDKIEIKFQSDKWKKPIALKVSRFEPFLAHIQLLCKEVNFKPEQFSLKFDGDDIDMKRSAIELEFEGGEIIDCRVKT